MTDFLRRNLFDFEQAEARRNAFFSLLVAAFLSPNIPMPGSLPAIRLEQLLLAVLLPSLYLYYRRHPEFRRPQLIDYAFLALGIAVVLTVVVAPALVDQANYSIRDPFEVARVAEYWLMFRLGFTVLPNAATVRTLVYSLAGVAIVSGVIGLLQYVDVASINSWFTDIYADAHNYDGVVRRGRVVGTVGNANYYGIFSGLLLAGALALVILRYPLESRRERWLVGGAVVLAVAGVVLSQSRTAAFAVIGALVIGLAVVLVLRRRNAAYGAAFGLFGLGLVLSITYVEVFPPEFGTFHQRFSLDTLADDPSVTVRISKVKSLFSGFGGGDEPNCVSTDLNARATGGHEPSQGMGANAPADVLARDATRKDDITRYSRAVLSYYCDEGEFPIEDTAGKLVPDYLDAIPADPGGQPYDSYLQPNGFMVAATLENAADPEGPVYGLGSIPNIVVNPSFEEGGSAAGDWQTAGSVDGRPSTVLTRVDERVYGEHAVQAEIGPVGSLYQLSVFDFPIGVEYTASVWAKSADGQEQTISLYMIGILSDGATVDPLASNQVTLPADGAWVPIGLTFTTPGPNRLTVLQFSVRAPAGSANVLLDGAMVNQGPFAPSFPYVADIDPSDLKPADLPGFSDSPFIGVGPRKDSHVGAFDNEYALFLDRYGAVGTLAYIALMASAFLMTIRGFFLAGNDTIGRKGIIAISLGLGIYTIAQAAFNIAAGSYYSFQLMAIYWLLIGFVARAVAEASRRPVTEPAVEPARSAVAVESARTLAGERRLGSAERGGQSAIASPQSAPGGDEGRGRALARQRLPRVTDPAPRRPRVCILTSVHPPLDTRVFYRQARSTAAAGFETLLIAPGAPASPVDGVRFESLPSGGGRALRPLRWPILFIRALRARADIFHFHDPELLPWGVLLHWITGRAVVYDSHEYLKEDIQTKHWIPARLRNPVAAIADRVEKWCAGRLSAVVTVTDEMADRFRPVQPRTITVKNLPPAPDVAYPPPVRDAAVAYAGLMNIERGLDILFETATLVRARVPEAEFRILGTLEWDGLPSTERDRTPAEWEAAGVRFLGTVPPSEVAAITTRARAGWLPRSPHHENNLLAWPNKLVEYMVVGLPVIASDLPLQARVIREHDCGRVVEALSPASHADAICEMLTDESEARRLGDNGRRAALLQYTWDAEASKLHTLYMELAGHR